MPLIDAIVTVGWNHHQSTSILGTGYGPSSISQSSIPITKLFLTSPSLDNYSNIKQENIIILDTTLSNASANLNNEPKTEPIYLGYEINDSIDKNRYKINENYSEEEIRSGIMEIHINKLQEYTKYKEEYSKTHSHNSVTTNTYEWHSIELPQNNYNNNTILSNINRFSTTDRLYIFYRIEKQHIFRSLSTSSSSISDTSLSSSMMMSDTPPIVDICLLKNNDYVPPRYYKLPIPLIQTTNNTIYLAYRRGTRLPSLGYCYLEPSILDTIVNDNNTPNTINSSSNNNIFDISNISSFIFPEGLRVRFSKEQLLSSSNNNLHIHEDLGSHIYRTSLTDDILDQESTSLHNRRTHLPRIHQRRRSLSYENNRSKNYTNQGQQTNAGKTALIEPSLPNSDNYVHRVNDLASLIRKFSLPKIYKSTEEKFDNSITSTASIPIFNYNVPPPKYRVTLLTKEDGSYQYIHNLVYYKQLSSDQQNLLEQLFLSQNNPSQLSFIRCTICQCLFQTSLKKEDELSTPKESMGIHIPIVLYCPSCKTSQECIRTTRSLSSSTRSSSYPLKGFSRETPKAWSTSKDKFNLLTPSSDKSSFPTFVTSTRTHQRSSLYIQQSLSILTSIPDTKFMKQILMQFYLLVSRVQRILPTSDSDIQIFVLLSLLPSRDHATWNIPKQILSNTMMENPSFDIQEILRSAPPAITLYSYIKYLFSTAIPKPRPSHSLRIPSLFCGITDPCISFPDRYALPSGGANNFTVLFHCFSSTSLIIIWKLLLLEQKIVIHSSIDALLTPICEALLTLLFPLKWQGVYIPLCPAHMCHLLECPTPFLLGLSTRQLPRRLKLLSDDIYIIDADHDRITRGWIYPPLITVTTVHNNTLPETSNRNILQNVEPKILRLRRYAHDDCLLGSDNVGDPFINTSMINPAINDNLISTVTVEQTITIDIPDDIQKLFSTCMQKIATYTGIHPGFGIPRYAHRIFPTKRLLISSLKLSNNISLPSEELFYKQITNAEIYNQRIESYIQNELQNCALLSMTILLSGYRSHVLWKSASTTETINNQLIHPRNSTSELSENIGIYELSDALAGRTRTRLSSVRTVSSIPTSISQAISSPLSEQYELNDSTGIPYPSIRPPKYRQRANTYASLSVPEKSVSRQQRGESTSSNVHKYTSYRSSPLINTTNENVQEIPVLDTQALNPSSPSLMNNRPSSSSNISSVSLGTKDDSFRERLLTFASQVSRISTSETIEDDSLEQKENLTESLQNETPFSHRRQRPIRPLRIYSPLPHNKFASPLVPSKFSEPPIATDDYGALCFIFDSRRFLACSSPQYVTFLRELIETQAFISFLQLRAQVPTYLGSPPLSLSSPNSMYARKRRGSSATRVKTPHEVINSTTQSTVSPFHDSPIIKPRYPPQKFVPIPPRINQEADHDSLHKDKVSVSYSLDPMISIFDTCVDIVRRWPKLEEFMLQNSTSTSSIPYLSEICQYGPAVASSSHGRCICGKQIPNENTVEGAENNNMVLAKYRLPRHMRKISAPAIVTASTIQSSTKSLDVNRRCTNCGLFWSHHPLPLTERGILPIASGIIDTAPTISSLIPSTVNSFIVRSINCHPSLYLPILYGYWPNNIEQDHQFIVNMIDCTMKTIHERNMKQSLTNVVEPNDVIINNNRNTNKLRVTIPDDTRLPPISPIMEQLVLTDTITNTESIVPSIKSTTVTKEMETSSSPKHQPESKSENVAELFSPKYHETILQQLLSLLSLIRNECLSRHIPIDDSANSNVHQTSNTPLSDNSDIFAILRTPKNESSMLSDISNLLLSSIDYSTINFTKTRNSDEIQWDYRIEDIDTNKITVQQWGVYHTLLLYMHYIEYCYVQLLWSSQYNTLSSLLSTISTMVSVFLVIVRMGSRIGIALSKDQRVSVSSSIPETIKYSIPLSIEATFRLILHVIQLAWVNPSLSSNDVELLRSTLVYLCAGMLQITPSQLSLSGWINTDEQPSIVTFLHRDTISSLHALLRNCVLSPPQSVVPITLLTLPLSLGSTNSGPITNEIHTMWFACSCSTCTQNESMSNISSISPGNISEAETLSFWNNNPQNSSFVCGICHHPLSPRIHLVRWIFEFISNTWKLQDLAFSSFPYYSPSTLAILETNHKIGIEEKVINLYWLFHRLRLPIQFIPIASRLYEYTDSITDVFSSVNVSSLRTRVYTIYSANGEVALTKTLSLLQLFQHTMDVPIIYYDDIIQKFNDKLHQEKLHYSLGIGHILPVYPLMSDSLIEPDIHAGPVFQLLLYSCFRPVVTLLYHGQIKEAVKYFINQRRTYRNLMIQNQVNSDVSKINTEIDPDIGLGQHQENLKWNAVDNNYYNDSVSTQTLSETTKQIDTHTFHGESNDICSYRIWNESSIFKSLILLAEIYTPYLLSNTYTRGTIATHSQSLPDDLEIGENISQELILSNLSSIITAGFGGTTGIGVLSKYVFTQSLMEWIQVQANKVRNSSSILSTFNNSNGLPHAQESINIPIIASWTRFFNFRSIRPKKHSNTVETVGSTTSSTFSVVQSFEEVIADALVHEIEEEAIYYSSQQSTPSPMKPIITAYDWPPTKLSIEIQRQFGYSSI